MPAAHRGAQRGVPTDGSRVIVGPRVEQSLGVGEGATITDPPLLEAVFMLCLTWSLGGALIQPARVQFDKYIKKLSGLPLQDRGEEIGLGALPNGLATLHDWSLDLDEKKWKPWPAVKPSNTWRDIDSPDASQLASEVKSMT